MDADVVIVGAGAAGGILAYELGAKGVRVAVLESGPRHDFAQRGSYVKRYLRHEDPWRSRLEGHDRHTVVGRSGYTLDGRRVRGLGGSTLHWEGYAMRFHESDFRMRSLHGVGDDWPIDYADLEPYYTRAENAFGVAGSDDDFFASPRSAPFPLPAFAYSHSDKLFAPACKRLGIAMQHLPQARNSVAYGGRAACRGCSTCHVCPSGAKASIDLTHIPFAERTGNVRIATEATVLRLEPDPTGRIARVVYALPDRIEQRMSGRVFVLAAGAVENARLLLNSKSREFPQGVANRSGAVGKYFLAHAGADISGRMPERVYPFRIGFSTAMSRQFAIGSGRSHSAAFFLEFRNSAGPTPEAIAVASGLTADALRKHVGEQFGHWLAIRVQSEPLADPANAITLAPKLADYFGSPAPSITHRIGGYEKRGIDEGTRVARAILVELGAKEIRVSGPGVTAHQMGTHRMGTDPATSVVDPNLRAHDIANLYLVGAGAFVTASASPPTLTIAALAIRAAEHIASVLEPS
jgi:choline dehydrogenase-like flavoprotein